jgi:putative heme iron utilization protein|tara:strand:+ start:419 stop:622 length:204 start_codon:yes stop_codon:yes gene_type:complete
MDDTDKKLKELHNKIDSIYTLLETLSDRLNDMQYSGRISYGNMYDMGKDEKIVHIQLKRKNQISDEE